MFNYVESSEEQYYSISFYAFIGNISHAALINVRCTVACVARLEM